MTYALSGKRILDLTITVAALILLAPVYVLATLAIVVDDGFPVLFSQSRVGKSGILFKVYKFRSMKTNVKDIPSADAPVDAVTRVGKFIRRTNIDELPQLINVLRGEMSIVGPRPALESQSDLLQARAASSAASLRPGLTGLAQVNAYDGMSEADKARWDTEYAAKVRFGIDIWILLRTVGYLFRRPPVY